MADRYCDGQLATGANDGTSWADAHQGATGLQAGIDAAVAGDTVHLTRAFTLAADIDIDQASGAAGNMIRVIGYNYNSGTPTNDGTKAVLDANSAADHCILVNNRNYWYWENVEFKNSATAANAAVSNTDEAEYWTFVNCDSHNAATSGWGRGNGSNKGFEHGTFFLCHAYSNGGGGGFYNLEAFGNIYIGCVSRNNAGVGMRDVRAYCYACVFADNSSHNVQITGAGLLAQCILDGSTGGDGVYLTANAAIVGCRFTNNDDDGIDGTASCGDWYNYYDSNAGTDVAITEAFNTVRGSDTRLTTGAQGYEDAANDIYNLVMGAAGFRDSIAMGASNNMVINRGLPNVPIVKPRG